MIMKKTLVLLFTVSQIVWCQAQNTISGILQSADNVPVDYANVVLLAQADSTFLTGTVSAEDGSFSLTAPAQTGASCLIRITCIGYKTLCRPAYTGNLGTLRMESDTQMLGEVVVKAGLPVTRLKGDAMATNIEGTLLAKAGTAQDMLNYIPGVASQKGSLQVLGRGAPVVYINGRLMRNASELEQLSSEDVLSVEVINNPGARYAASVKAVIRIQTRKAAGDGLGFNNRMYAGYNRNWEDLLEQFNVNYRRGGLDIFGMLYLYRGYEWDRSVFVQDTYLDKHWRQILNGESHATHKNLTADLGMNYMFNPNHSTGFKYRFDRYPDGDKRDTFDAEILEDGAHPEETQSSSRITSQSSTHTVNLYYNGAVNDWNIDFNTDLLWTDADENTAIQERTTHMGTVTERPVDTRSNKRNRLYASKLVFSHPLFGGDVAFGGEFSHTNRNTDYRNPQGILADDVNEIRENNVSAFAEYGRTLGRFRLQAGLRYERTMFDYDENGIPQDEQSKTYDEFFPSVSVGTSFDKVNMQLGYTQDISRPGFHALRSTVYYANRYTYETGNPFLTPAVTHNVSLMSVYKWWQLYVSYQRQKDEVMFTMTPYSDDDPNIALIKPVNAKSYDIAYARLTATPTLGVWSPRFTLSVRKQWFDVETPEGRKSLDRPQVTLRWQNSLRLPAGFLFGLDGRLDSKYDYANSRATKTGWAADASLRKGFLDDRLTFQLNAYDMFLTRRYSRVNYFSEIYVMGTTRHPNTRSVSLTVRYRFNQAKNTYKGTGAGEAQKNRF
jgi:hypothetical protein